MTDFLKIKNVLTCLACTNNKKKEKFPYKMKLNKNDIFKMKI